MHLHPCSHQLQHCFGFYKTLEKHRLNVGPECPHQEGPLGLVGTQNPRLSQHIGLWGHPLFLPGWAGDLPSLSVPYPASGTSTAGRGGSSLPGTLAGSVGTGTHSSLSRAVRVGIRPVQSSAQLRHPGWVFGSGGIFAAVLPWVPQSSGASSPLTLSLGSESASFLPPGRCGGERGTKRHLPVRGRWQGRRGRALPHAGEEWWW